jgi:hypothetical protein
MALHLILGVVAFLTGASTALFIVLVLGIRRGAPIGEPGSRAEVFAHRVLTGLRGCDARDKAEEDR